MSTVQARVIEYERVDVQLAELVAGARVDGLRGDGSVTILAAEHAGDSACTVTFRAADGSVGQAMVFGEKGPQRSSARRVRNLGADVKWNELSTLLTGNAEIVDATGQPPMSWPMNV
ncbi:MAG: hypothetical protein H0U28_01235 [Nocardioidaceae bacterium]|nr:hypothetical protein [Nocardioidaceae bacterium]